MRRALFALILTAATVGCYSKTPEAAKVPLGQSASAAPEANADISGPVVETLDAATYTYLRISTAKGDVWAAVPAAKIEKGTKVTLANAMLMSKFESKTLNRTFDEIYFGTIAPSGGTAAAGASAAVAGGNPHATAGQAPASVAVGKVEKASGADARTVAEAWAQKGSLVGKTVTIRGVVVKTNDGVMGKNWIHLQDGSGDAKSGTNDITVTSSSTAAKGETITVTGTVRTNKDFGAGYVYAIIVEDAKVTKK